MNDEYETEFSHCNVKLLSTIQLYPFVFQLDQGWNVHMTIIPPEERLLSSNLRGVEVQCGGNTPIWLNNKRKLNLLAY